MAINSSDKDDGVADQAGASPPAQPIPPASSSSSPSQQPTMSSSWPPPHYQPEPQPHINFSTPELNDGSLFDMIRYISSPPLQAAPAAPFLQPAIPPPLVMQPTMQPQHCNHQPLAMLNMQGSHYNGYLGDPWAHDAAHYALLPDAPLPPAGPAIGRRRSRPPGTTVKHKRKLAMTAAPAAEYGLMAATSGHEWPTLELPSAIGFATIARQAGEVEEHQEDAEDAVGDEAKQEVVEYADTSVPGVRFIPNDVEMIGYLRSKYLGRRMPVDFIKEFNVFKDHPSIIQEKFGDSINGAWYVFTPRNRKYKNGYRPNRSVGGVGYWKSNTKEIDIKVNTVTIGRVNSLTFHLGRQPKGTKTPWKLKEYSIEDYQLHPDPPSMLLDPWVICKLFRAGAEGHDDVDQFDDGGEQVNNTGANAGKDTIDGNQSPNEPEQELGIEDYDYLALDEFAYRDPGDQ